MQEISPDVAGTCTTGLRRPADQKLKRITLAVLDNTQSSRILPHKPVNKQSTKESGTCNIVKSLSQIDQDRQKNKHLAIKVLKCKWVDTDRTDGINDELINTLGPQDPT